MFGISSINSKSVFFEMFDRCGWKRHLFGGRGFFFVWWVIFTSLVHLLVVFGGSFHVMRDERLILTTIFWLLVHCLNTFVLPMPNPNPWTIRYCVLKAGTLMKIPTAHVSSVNYGESHPSITSHSFWGKPPILFPAAELATPPCKKKTCPKGLGHQIALHILDSRQMKGPLPLIADASGHSCAVAYQISWNQPRAK